MESKNSIKNGDALDLTKISQHKNDNKSILPPAILAAQMFNKTNQLSQIEVELPILREKVKCNAIPSLDEITAKTIIGSMYMYMDHNVKLFYNCCEFGPDSTIQNYEDFISLCEADFKTIIYGVLRASYKKLNESSYFCENEKCTNPDEKKIFTSTQNLNDIEIEYPKGAYDSPSGDFRKDVFIADTGEGFIIKYKFDSIKERLDLFRSKSNQEIRNNIEKIGLLVPKIELFPLYIESIEIQNENEPENPYILKEANEIMIFMGRLNSSAKETIEDINNQFINHILDYTPKFHNHNLVCPHCNYKNRVEELDLLVEFFLKISAVY